MRNDTRAASFLNTNVGGGLFVGAFIATGYSVWAVVVRVLVGPGPFEARSVTFPALVLAYYAGGLLGGAIVGSLWSLHKRWYGAILLGFLGFLPCVLTIAWMTTPPDVWGWDLAAGISGLSLIIGGGIGLALWKEAGSEAGRSRL